MAKKTFFNEFWLKDPKFQPWLKKDKKSKNSFKCEFCRTKNSLLNMWERALESHIQVARHKQTR